MKRMTTVFAVAATTLLAAGAQAAEATKSPVVDGAAIVTARAGAKLTAAWRVAGKPGGTLTLEAVDAKGVAAVGFIIQPEVDDQGALRQVTIGQIGHKSGIVLDRSGKLLQSSPFAGTERELLLGAGEDLGALDAATNTLIARSWFGDWLGSINGLVSCIRAATSSGTDVISDAECAVAVVKAEK